MQNRYMVLIFLLLSGLNYTAFAQQGNISTSEQRIETSGKSVFIFNPRTQRWSAYNRSGSLVASGHGSGGRDYCPDIKEPCRTPVGTFYVDGFGGEDCLSMEIPGQERAHMPYCMHTTGDFSIHGFASVPNSMPAMVAFALKFQWRNFYMIMCLKAAPK